MDTEPTKPVASHTIVLNGHGDSNKSPSKKKDKEKSQGKFIPLDIYFNKNHTGAPREPTGSIPSAQTPIILPPLNSANTILPPISSILSPSHFVPFNLPSTDLSNVDADNNK
jgi:hypothetical protein